MFQLRPAESRGQTRLDWLDSRHSFSFGDYFDPRNMNFGVLRVINDDWVSPGAGFGMHPHRDMEILTYILSGELEHRDSLGNRGTIRAGEMQRITAGTGILHSEYNPSASESVHLLQIWIRPDSQGRTPDYEQKRLVDGLPGEWQTIASPDGENDSIRMNQNVRLLRNLLEADAATEYPLARDRQYWLHVTRGDVVLGDEPTLRDGDSVSINEEATLRLKANRSAEVLLFELPIG